MASSNPRYIPHADIGERLRILDDEVLTFGNDDDFKIKYDTGDGRLEILDASDNVLIHVTDDGSSVTIDITGDVTLDDLDVDGLLRHVPATTTISSGAITATANYMKIDTEGAASSDDLDTINGLTEGMPVYFSSVGNARDITYKHGTGNIRTDDGSDETPTITNHFVAGLAIGSNVRLSHKNII